MTAASDRFVSSTLVGVGEFRVIFLREFAHVAGLLRRLGVKEHDLEDVAHDVFLVAYEKFAQYRPDVPARFWLSGIALRVASNYRRRQRTRRSREVDGSDDRVDAMPAPAASRPDDRLDERQLRELLQEGLDTLDEKKREVFVLYELNEMTVPEIASLLGTGDSTIYSRLGAAREDFKKAIVRIRRKRRDQ